MATKLGALRKAPNTLAADGVAVCHQLYVPGWGGVFLETSRLRDAGQRGRVGRWAKEKAPVFWGLDGPPTYGEGLVAQDDAGCGAEAPSQEAGGPRADLRRGG